MQDTNTSKRGNRKVNTDWLLVAIESCMGMIMLALKSRKIQNSPCCFRNAYLCVPQGKTGNSLRYSNTIYMDVWVPGKWMDRQVDDVGRWVGEWVDG